jgi:hypothetical protein
MLKGWKKRSMSDILFKMNYRLKKSNHGLFNLMFPLEVKNKLTLLHIRGIIKNPEDSEWYETRYRKMFLLNERSILD